MGTFYAPNDYRNYIAHFGVKGMKWGVRKQRYGGGLGTMITKHRIHRHALKANKHVWAAAELALQGRRTGNAHLTDAAQASLEASEHYRKKAAELQKRNRPRRSLRQWNDDRKARIKQIRAEYARRPGERETLRRKFQAFPWRHPHIFRAATFGGAAYNLYKLRKDW